jgi:acyl carrier protein
MRYLPRDFLDQRRAYSMDYYPWIRGIIAKELSMDEEDVVPDAHLLNDLGADSLALVTLAEAISARYGIELVADDLVDTESVGELIKLVESRASSKP